MTASIGRTVPSSVPSVLRISPNTIATSPCRPATELRRSSSSESRLQLHWDPQTLRCVCAKSAIHQRPFPVSDHPSVRISWATRPRAGEYGRVHKGTTPTEESGSIVCRTQESDRIASLAPAAIEVRSRAVLVGRAAQNIKRLVRFLDQQPHPILPATT